MEKHNYRFFFTAGARQIICLEGQSGQIVLFVFVASLPVFGDNSGLAS